MRLRQAISDASRDDQGAQYQAAAERQRAEIDRTAAYAHSIGCDHRQFLFFGSAPPAQCGQINAQIGRMRANFDELMSRAGAGASGRRDLIARYNAQCLNPRRRSRQTSSRRCSAAAGPDRPMSRSSPLNPDATLETADDPIPARRARDRRRSACAPATAASFRFPIRPAAGAWTASRTCAARCARTPTSTSIPIPRRAKSSRPSRSTARATWIARRR